jgi:dynein heavy chain
LDILSNGNSPGKINKHMSKIFQAIDMLDLKDQGGARPVAVGIKSGVGKEYVPYDSPLELAGKVESYLATTIEKMVSTLHAIT